MAVSTGSYMKGFHETARTLGSPSIASDYMLEIKGFEHTALLIVGQFWPELSVSEAIELPAVAGTKMLRPAQTRFDFQKSISMKETEPGIISKMLIDILCQGATFDATVYHGNPAHFIEAREIKECFLIIEMPETSFENRTQPLLFTGQIAGHYYNDKIMGNVPNLYGRDGQGGSC